MNTDARIEILARVAPAFALWLGEMTAAGLRDLLEAELGSPLALEDFQPHGKQHFSKAIAPRTILHVVSGNTPHAGLQSLLRGLLLGSHNFVKLPTGGVPEIAAFRDALPTELAARVELAEMLPDAWLTQAEAVIVFGADATIEEFRQRTRADQKFLAHGHRVSFGVVFETDDAESAAAAARDASLFDQRGCQSPQLFYVRGGAPRVLAWAAALAHEMEVFNQKQPRAKLVPADAARIHALREEWRFRAASAPAGEVALWASASSTDWTVICDARDPAFVASPSGRVVFVKPLPASLATTLGPAVRQHLGAIGFWPATPENGRALAALDLPASRLCPIGQMQAPPLLWHQDGLSPLGALVRWTDLEISP